MADPFSKRQGSIQARFIDNCYHGGTLKKRVFSGFYAQPSTTPIAALPRRA